MGASQLPDGGFEPAVCQPDAADDGIVFRQAEDAGPGVSRLGPGGDGAYFHKPESQGGDFAKGLSVAVESGGQPHGIGEADAEDLALEGRMPHGTAFAQEPPAPGDYADEVQEDHHHAVRLLDGERKEDRFYDMAVHIRFGCCRKGNKKERIR